LPRVIRRTDRRESDDGGSRSARACADTGLPAGQHVAGPHADWPQWDPQQLDPCQQGEHLCQGPPGI